MWILYILLAYAGIYLSVIILAHVIGWGLACLRSKQLIAPNFFKSDIEEKNKPDISLEPINERLFEYFSEEEKLYCLSAPNETERKRRFMEVIATDTSIMCALFSGAPATPHKNTKDPENTND